MLPPEKYKRVLQPKGSRICVACVTAMVMGRTLRYATFRMKPSRSPNGLPYYRTREMLKLLGANGINCGQVFQSESSTTYIDLSSPINSFILEHHPAVLTVKSLRAKRDEYMHVVFWTGREVLDPWPEVSGSMPWQHYKIREVMPVVYLDER